MSMLSKKAKMNLNAGGAVTTAIVGGVEASKVATCTVSAVQAALAAEGAKAAGAALAAGLAPAAVPAVVAAGAACTGVLMADAAMEYYEDIYGETVFETAQDLAMEAKETIGDGVDAIVEGLEGAWGWLTDW